MSPDLDAGLLRGVDDPRVVDLGGRRHRHRRRSADHSCPENEINCSPSSPVSSVHALCHNPDPLSPNSDAPYDGHRDVLDEDASHTRPVGSSVARPLVNTRTAIRALPRSNVRSTSSPLDTASPAPGAFRAPTGKPSVKDLKKRFDQGGDAASASKSQVRPSNAPLRATRPSGKPANRALETRAPNANAPMQAALESGAATRAQRSKLVAQSAVPGSSQSFASRIAKPRGSNLGKVTGSKSLTQLPQRVPHQHLSSLPPTTSRPPGLLFGEVTPGPHAAAIAGFGIRGARPSRTSTSGNYSLAGHHHRSLSGSGAESPSPSSWYVDALEKQSQTPSSAHSRPRTRSRSDAAASLASIEIEISHDSSPGFSVSLSPDPSPSASKLPVSVRRMSGPVSQTSPSSSRSTSPSAFKCSLPSSRIPGATSAAASRASASVIRAKTPTGRKPPPQPLTTPDKNARLQAYIAAPPPKLSPPLRSSRPRMPISTATTLGLGIKDTSRQSCVDAPAPSGPSKVDNGPARRRKISFGPIDFEQRREHIRLAYSKSIRESEALEERQVAAERRRRESEEATKAFAAAETTPSASVKVTHGTSVAGSDVGRETEMDGASENRQPSSRHFEAGPAIAPAQQLVTAPVSRPVTRPRVPPLTVRTALDSKQDVISQDSPTLGVPGGFSPLGPSANSTRQPLSALSATSETTEFNVEPQTNPPIQTQSPLDVPITVVKPPSPERAALAHQTGYRYSFKDEATQPVKSLKTAEELASAADTRDTDAELPAPGGFSDELEESALPRRTDQPRGTVAKVVSQTGTRSGSISDSVTAPFPRMDTQDESDCHSDLGTAAQGSYDSRHDDGATDACTEETDDVDRSGHRRSDFRRDELYSHRTSACTSSDAGALDDDELGLQDPGPIVNASNLAVPLSRLQTDRLSQQSAWTDFSVDSTDPSDNARSSTRQSGQESPSFGHFTIFESRRASRESALYKDTRFATGLQRPHGPKEESIHTSQTQLPEVDTGGGLFVPSLSPGAASASPSFIPSPDHEPPPVPISAPASTLDSRTSSAFYDQSHYGSTLINSEREAGDFTSSLATPQSLDAATTETGYHFQVRRSSADDSAKLKAPEDDGKERHRLVQRHNVIKELVDTEAVFVRDMNIVEEIYKGTAEACPKLDSKTVKLIFRNSSEIIDFHTYFLKALKEAVTSVYVPAGESAGARREESTAADQGRHGARYSSDGKDRMTSLGPVFQRNMESMKLAHEGFLRNSDQAAKRLIQIQQDPTVKVWLNECKEVAKDLTAAWDLDSLLIKPMQRITKYPNLIMTLLQHTPQDHPDREALVAAKDCLETAIIEINKNKKNFELVGQIVGRKRKESDSKAGFARAFGKRVDKLQASNNRPLEDPDYAKLNDKFGDDYLRLQVVLRDVEFYTRQVSAYVHEFLQYLSSVELVMRLQPGNYPELESKWVQFNISVRDLEKVALEEHLTQVRKHVIEPFELVIKAYGNPALAMKKRQKRRLDYERSEQLKRSGRTADPKLRDLVEQYEALNDTLKKELPTLSALTEKVGNICLGNFVNIQTEWYAIWKDKMKTVLGDCPEMPDLQDVVSTFQRDYPYARDQLAGIGILNPTSRGRLSQSTSSVDDSTIRSRGRGFSVNGDAAPTLPAPDFGGRRSGSFSMSPGTGGPGVVTSSPQQYHYRDYYAGIHAPQGTAASSARSPEMATSSRSVAGTGAASTRPSTGRSLDSGGGTRQSSESANQQRRDSNTTYNSSYVPHESRRYSNIFHSALPLPDGPEDSRRSSRASSRERNQTSDGYNILWLAASLFEFNISTTKHEAGYPYLTYQAGEIFDVIAEKGELWLAKNQDNATDQVGWIWSKHFAKLADS